MALGRGGTGKHRERSSIVVVNVVEAVCEGGGIVFSSFEDGVSRAFGKQLPSFLNQNSEEQLRLYMR